jgi:futalosine hydrolase
MKVLLVAATPFEIAPTLTWLEGAFARADNGVFFSKRLDIQVLVTGVGLVATAWHLAQTLGKQRPDWAINAGVAGAFDRRLRLGDVVHVVTERFGDLGVEESDGRFVDLFELGLLNADFLPFSGKMLVNSDAAQAHFLPTAHGLTVNLVHGSAESIAAIQAKYPDAQVESMEGAAFFYGCLSAGIPFVEIRGVSNFVEPRNRAAWDLPLAIKNLNARLVEMLEAIL